MAGFTVEVAQSNLQFYLDAEMRVLRGQTVQIGQRKLALANLGEIQAGIRIWKSELQEAQLATSGLGRSVNVAPRW